jgi:hypothetical protein
VRPYLEKPSQKSAGGIQMSLPHTKKVYLLIQEKIHNTLLNAISRCSHMVNNTVFINV